MSRYANMVFDPTLRQVLDLLNTDELKKLLALLPGVKMKAPRKGEVVDALERFLLSDGVVELWKRLGSLEQSAVAESVHECDGAFDPEAFRAKYGGLPAFETKTEDPWRREPRLLRLFIHPPPAGESFRTVPRDLREKLLAFIPEPAAAQLKTLEEIPARPPRQWTKRRFDEKERTTVYEDLEMPLVTRLTEQAAFQDLRTTLRLIDQEKLPASSTTRFPSKAAMKLLDELLRDHDFLPLTEKENKWDPEIGPVKGFSWPLLVQAAKLASVRNEKLALTKTGRSALESLAPQTLRDIWNAWIGTEIIDEFSRIDTIKGQKGKGRRSFTPPPDRRRTVSDALSECPVGRWVEVDEFSRFMRAAGFAFQVTRNSWDLYICDPKYGSLGYEGYGGWNILQERYLLCLLLEYAAPLGMVDVAYEHPAGARSDYGGQWGTDGLMFLSRYDGLRYFRLTPLGAFILDVADTYEFRDENPGVALTVLPNRQIRIDHGELSPDETLLLENFADHQGAALWLLDEIRALKSIEKGAGVGELRAFLKSRDPQPLPETVESFLASVQQRGAACLCKGTALLVECLSPTIAETIAGDTRAGKLCQRAGDRGLVVPLDKEKAFREALNGLGYGMPRV